VDGIEKESISVTDTQLGWWEERNFGEEHSWCLGRRVNQGRQKRRKRYPGAESEGGTFPMVLFFLLLITTLLLFLCTPPAVSLFVFGLFYTHALHFILFYT
jgi:Flp pilus assembly protein TadB